MLTAQKRCVAFDHEVYGAIKPFRRVLCCSHDCHIQASHGLLSETHYWLDVLGYGETAIGFTGISPRLSYRGHRSCPCCSGRRTVETDESTQLLQESSMHPADHRPQMIPAAIRGGGWYFDEGVLMPSSALLCAKHVSGCTPAYTWVMSVCSHEMSPSQGPFICERA